MVACSIVRLAAARLDRSDPGRRADRSAIGAMASRFAELWLAPRLGGDVDAGVHQPSWLVVNDRERHGTLRADTPERRGDDGPGERHLLLRRPSRPPSGATDAVGVAPLHASKPSAGPRVVERDGERVWVCEGPCAGRQRRTAEPRAEKIRQLSAIGRAGIDDDGYRAGNAKLRLEDLDRDGLAASVIYGPLAHRPPDRRSRAPDDRASRRGTTGPPRSSTPSPPIGCRVLAFLPSHSPEAAAAELERCAALGHRGAIIDVFDDRPRRPGVGPALGRRRAPPASRSASTSRAAPGRASATRSASGSRPRSPRSCRCSSTRPLATMIFSGVARTAPRAAARAGGVGRRLAAVLPRTRRHGVERPQGQARRTRPSIPPSELFRRQVYRHVRGGRACPEQIPLLGADSCMWASDYPHTDSTFPDRGSVIDETLGALTADDRRKITATNCAELYRLAFAS